MFQDKLIPRLRAAGLTVHDVRAQLPRRGTWMTRPLSAITGISDHWDAEHRPHAYDSLKRYIGQANYHINKDWGGGSRGDGLMYHIKVDNIGDIYITREFEHVLWNVGNSNYNYIGICWDGTTGQNPTREQAEAFDKLHDVLTTQCPEFPAGRANVKGHQEVPGNSTACPGSFMTPVREYRASGNVNAAQYPYEYPPAPAPAPSQPAPTPPPAPKPAEWKPIEGGAKSMIVNQATALIDATNNKATTTTYAAGRQIDNLVEEYVNGNITYWRTAYSKSKNINNGFNRAHLSPVPTPPPAPTPEPPKPTPTPQPSDKDKEQDVKIGALEAALGGLLNLIKSIGELITGYFKK